MEQRPESTPESTPSVRAPVQGPPGGSTSSGRCEFCHRLLDTSEDRAVGRPRKYCRRSCRQRAYERRRRLSELEWGESSVSRLGEQIEELAEQLARIDDLIDEVRLDLAETGGLDGAELLERLVHARK